MIAFDLGASSGRGMIGSYDNERIAFSEFHRFQNTPVSINGSLQWDVLFLYGEMIKGLKGLSASGDTYASLGIDTWGLDVAFLDTAGLLIGNPLHYQNVLTLDVLPSLFEKIDPWDLYSRTALQQVRIKTLPKIFALHCKYPHFLPNCENMLFICDLFNYFFTGVKACERSIASTSQMCSVEAGDWDTDLLHRLSLPTQFLTPIASPCKILGKFLPSVAQDVGFSLPVALTLSHDTSCAFLATPFDKKERSAVLSCGTRALLGVELDAPIATKEAFIHQFSSEKGVDGTTRLLKSAMGLYIYQQLCIEFSAESAPPDYDMLNAQAYGAPAHQCFIDPDHELFSQPGPMAARIRDFCQQTGQTAPDTKEALLRCVLESLTLNYALAFSSLEAVLNEPVERLYVVGGGGANKTLMQFLADCIDRPVFSGPKEAAVLGNLFSQLIALGELKDRWEARTILANSSPTTQYLPQSDHSWQTAAGRFLAIKNKFS